MTSVVRIQLCPGDLLYREGDANDYAYVIESGEVILYSAREGQRRDVERRGAGSIIGELSILTGRPRAVTVEALTDCTVYRMSAEQILSRFEKLDPVLRACVETSIFFTNTLTRQTTQPADEVPVAQRTLRNADKLMERFRLETDMVQGLKEDQFSLVFQPIMGLRDGSIAGFEALMRWQHPSLGHIPPDRFIEVAETTGSIKRLTEFAIVETCGALKRLRALLGSPKDLFATVNVSGQDIGRRGFVEFLAFVLEADDIQPEYLKLEVTETALIPDFDIADKNFKQLQAMGCGISIDDFGTGYSNLAYLKSLPITSLKIDRAFAGDAHDNPVSRSIVKMLVTLGQDLGVDVIAEGLETEGDVETLRGLGCRFAQGFYFHKPVPEVELKTLICDATRSVDVA